jgi:superfamily I DNA and/or RNA helicase
MKQEFNTKASLSNIEINTVDQFQGRDKRMIMYSFTKCKNSSDKLSVSPNNIYFKSLISFLFN